MASVVLTVPSAVPALNSVTVEISVEAETWSALTTNPTGKNSVTKVKAAFALLYTVLKQIPAGTTPPLPGGKTADDIIAGLLPLMAASVALAEAAPDFA